MNVVTPWAILMGFLTYKYGVKAKRMPEPYRYLGGTALMAFAAVIAQANATLGTLVAWGFLLGAMVYVQKNPGTAQAQGPQAPRGKAS